MGTQQDKIVNAFKKTIDEVLGEEPIYEFVRLKLKKISLIKMERI